MSFIRRFSLAALLLSAAAAFAQVPTAYPITTQNLVPAGDCTVGSCVVADMQSKGGASVEVRGTYTASGGLSLQRTNTGVWETVSASSSFTPVGGTGTATIASAATGTWGLGACVGFRYCRVTALGAVTGTATVTVYTTTASTGGSTTVSGGAGDASASNQVTGNNSLASIDTKTPALGQALAAAASPVVLPALQNAVNTQGSTTSGQSGALVQGAVTTGSPAYTTAQTSPLSLDTSGNLRVNVVTGGAGGGNVTGGTAHDAVGTSVNPVLVGGYASAAAPTDVSTDGDVVREWRLRNGAGAMQQTFAGILAATGSGAVNTGTQRVVHATDDPVITAINADPNYTITPGGAAPTRILALGGRSGANVDALAQGGLTAPINVSTATTTQIVALSGTTLIRVTGLAVIAGGTGNITFVYGTGSNCGTGTTSLTGAFPLVANAGLTIGGGVVLMVPSGQALCVTTSAAVQMSGFVTYAQF